MPGRIPTGVKIMKIRAIKNLTLGLLFLMGDFLNFLWTLFNSKVRRGSIGSASACCKAGPSSILGSAPHGGSSLAERRSDEDTRRQASANDER
jgi:hypothetical protein